MNLENIKNSIKESIVRNFMENVKHARRGPEHQRPKSWSKGTKSGSDKKKMRREGKDAAREMNEARYEWSSRRNSLAGYRREMGERKLESYQREFAKTNVIPLLQKHGAENTKDVVNHPWWYKVGGFSSGLPDERSLSQLKSHPEFSSYISGLKSAHEKAHETSKDMFERGWHRDSLRKLNQMTESLSESLINLEEEESLSLRDRAAKLRALAYSLPSHHIPTPAVNVRTQPAGQTPLKKEKDPKIPNPEIIQTTVALSNIEYDNPIRHKISSPALQRLKNLGFTKDQLGENDKGYRITDPVINLLVK